MAFGIITVVNCFSSKFSDYYHSTSQACGVFFPILKSVQKSNS